MTAKLPEDVRAQWLLIPLNVLKTTDVANTAVYLASELSDYVSDKLLACVSDAAIINHVYCF